MYSVCSISRLQLVDVVVILEISPRQVTSLAVAQTWFIKGSMFRCIYRQCSVQLEYTGRFGSMQEFWRINFVNFSNRFCK